MLQAAQAQTRWLGRTVSPHRGQVWSTSAPAASRNYTTPARTGGFSRKTYQNHTPVSSFMMAPRLKTRT